MNNRATVVTLSGVLGFVMSAGTALATDVDVRDALGGETSEAPPGSPGLYIAPTGARLHAATAIAPVLKDFAVGTFGFEKRVSGSGDPWESFMTYCFEPDQAIEFAANPLNTTGVTYKQAALTAQSGITAGEASALEILWHNAFAESKTTEVKAAAFQAIVWELGSSDAAYNLASGDFLLGFGQGDMFEEMVKAQADAWFAKIGTDWTVGTGLDVLIRSSSQNLLIPRGSPPVIPLPTAAGLASLGLVGLTLRRRRPLA